MNKLISFSTKHLFEKNGKSLNRLINVCSSRYKHDDLNVGIYSIDPACGLNDEQKEIYDMASKFAKTKMKPFMTEWDKKEIFPIEVLKEAGNNRVQLNFFTYFDYHI